MKKLKQAEGIIEFTRNGHAYLIVSSKGHKDDLFIHKKNTGHALHGDKIVVSVFEEKSKKGTEIQGLVKGIIERKTTEFSGVVDISKDKGFAFVRTSGGKMPVDFFVPLENLNGAKDGEVVVVKLNRWYKKDKSPKGIITKVIGTANTHEAEMGNIMFKHNIDYSFPSAVIKEAESIPVEIPEREILKRRDMRDTLTMTIDGADARDLDDALSFKVLENGNYEIGVNIADIGYYVKKGGYLDNEALKRGTSIYLVDRVLPMFPTKLSNEVCSLNPNKDKLTVSVIFEITPEGNVENHKFKKTVINSNYRFTYDKVQDTIEGHHEENLGNVEQVIKKLDDIAKKIRTKRFKNGAVSFSRKEPQFILDEKGVPIDVFFRESKDAHQLIEEYMLLANRYVATFLYKNKIPAAFRVHDSPNEEKLQELSVFVIQFGYKLNVSGSRKQTKESLNKLLKTIKGTPEESMISMLAIRCMSKAECNPINIGHYGLGDNFMPPNNAYGWFTSGIRRYADLLNQRQLFDFLNRKK